VLRQAGHRGVAAWGRAPGRKDYQLIDEGPGALQAFGDPVEYARSLRLPVKDHWARAMLWPLAPVVVQVVGMLVFSWSTGFSRNGHQLVVTTGNVIIGLVALLALTAMVLFFESVLNMVVYHRIWTCILLVFAWVASTATMVVALTYFDGVLWPGSAGWGLAAGASALVAGVVWAIARRRALGSYEDPITSPFDGVVSLFRRLSRPRPTFFPPSGPYSRSPMTGITSHHVQKKPVMKNAPSRRTASAP
jgi:hypothetical protein